MTKVKVDHTGICEGHYFEKDKVIDLPDTAVTALGTHAKIVNPETEVQPSKIKRVLKTKNVKRAPFDTMVKAPQVISKDE